MIYLAREYIKYCLKAKHRHGVHSPYVYDFNDICLSLTIPQKVQQDYLSLFRSFTTSKEVIKVNDLGAGSKHLSLNRKVKKIAKISGSKAKYARLLYRLVAHYQPQNVLELGTSLGLGTFMLAAASDNIHIITVEGCKITCDFAKNSFPKDHIHKVDFVNDEFLNYINQLNSSTVFDLIFIDGDHKAERLFQQLNQLRPFIHDETIIVLDDIRWSKDMLEAWETIKKNNEYHLTIDLFKMGIIAPRKHQQKEHFIIRY